MSTHTEILPRVRRRPGVDADSPNYRWWALSCTSLGMLLAATNSGTLIIALPDLERSLHTSLLALVWVILAYMIASTVLVLTAGRLSDLFGRKRAYVGGFVVFGPPHSEPGFAANGDQLILWRILQGIASAFLFANSAALVTDAFPREQLGVAMGANMMVAASDWCSARCSAARWWDLLALGVLVQRAARARRCRLGCGWCCASLPSTTARGFDVGGTITFVIGLTGLVLGVSRGGLSGWNDPIVIGGFAIAAVLLPPGS
jgi:MFS family permease